MRRRVGADVFVRVGIGDQRDDDGARLGHQRGGIAAPLLPAPGHVAHLSVAILSDPVIERGGGGGDVVDVGQRREDRNAIKPKFS